MDRSSTKRVEPHWCVVRVEGGRERRAQYFLELQQHHQTYCPRFLDLRQSKSIRPVYPGYMFVYLHNLEFAFLRTTPCVVGPVMLGPRPNVVSERIIMDMKLREDERGLLPLIETKYKRGQTVRVTQGPLLGQSGCYDGYVRADHHRVILDILQGAKTEVPDSWIEAA